MSELKCQRTSIVDSNNTNELHLVSTNLEILPYYYIKTKQY